MVYPLVVVALSVVLALTTACGSGDGSQRNVNSVPNATTPSSDSPPTVTASPPTSRVQAAEARKAPEFVGLTNWLNSEPLTIAGLNAQRRVVLIDVWTYTCVNCIRTFPYLKIWHERYKDHGLTIIGVHSPEFEFEKAPANVKAAVERHGLMYPVAQDDDRKTWDAYDNNYWPSKYL
ncbi:MAG: redoxin domain-containing protein, partial [Chloroflexi bacterium]|nr:redoxin domain-containing protein [Chloroflexota bacterium]